MRVRLGQVSTRRAAGVAAILLVVAVGGSLLGVERTPAAGHARETRASTAPAVAFTGLPLAFPAAAAVIPRNPFATRAMRRFLHARSGNITAGVYDVATKTTFLYHPDDREQTASIIKANILALLLAQAQARHDPLDADDLAIATGMIEESDNDDATDLWDAEGGAPAVAAFDARLHMTQTMPSYAWGLTETTPRDQLRLLRHIALTNRVLHYNYREPELYLMEHVVSDDYWGITAGPTRATVAVKNGWLPVAGGWQINSIGMVHGDHRFYLIAVMTNGNPEEGYGIDTIEGISRLIWKDLRQRRASGGSTGPSGVSGATGTSGSTASTGATAAVGAS
ncbi:MAG TPA: serine hydrolase [Solirubrobacteraceae bacterium]|nr:serine hydrolase [Solirubrobacteraceae bacterium]